MKEKNNNFDISFICKVPGIDKIEECRPKPVSKYIPEWWKKMPTRPTTLTIDGPNFGNAKVCPSFADYFSNGYIMPMWTDSIIYYDSEKNIYRWRTASQNFSWDRHPNDQYLEHVDHKFFGKKSYFILKTECPWVIFSKEKYLMYQLPPFFHFNEDFSIIPGVRDISKYNMMNIQFVIHSDKKEIFIERGTPIAHFIPFQKENLNIDVRSANEQDKENIEAFYADWETKFTSTYKSNKT